MWNVAPAKRAVRPAAVALLAIFASLCWSQALADTLRIGGTGATHALMQRLGAAFAESRPGLTFEFPPSLGSGGGVRAVQAGAIDLATTSRPLKQSERDAGAVSHLFARTPFMFVTSRPGSTISLDESEIVAMFGLQQTTWPDGSHVRLILRPTQDSDSTLLIDSFRGMEAALATARRSGGIPVGTTDQETLDLAEAIPGALTTATLAVVSAERRRVTPIEIGTVAPTVANLETGRYRISKPLYFATGPNPTPLVRAFMDFVRSPAGSEILRAYGCLPANG